MLAWSGVDRRGGNVESHFKLHSHALPPFRLRTASKSNPFTTLLTLPPRISGPSGTCI